MPELIRLELERGPAIEQRNAPPQDLTARERRLYVALMAVASLNVFIICGTLSFLWLVFRD
jgi:hypothetical protein